MRIVVCILAVLGGLAAGGFGFIVLQQTSKQTETMQLQKAELDKMMAEATKDQKETAKAAGLTDQINNVVFMVRLFSILPYALLAAAPLALLACVLAIMRKRLLTAILLLLVRGRPHCLCLPTVLVHG